MRKMMYRVIVICPFDYCQMNSDHSKMNSACQLACKYAEFMKEEVGETVHLDASSEEVKYFNMKYSNYDCVDCDNCDKEE